MGFSPSRRALYLPMDGPTLCWQAFRVCHHPKVPLLIPTITLGEFLMAWCGRSQYVKLKYHQPSDEYDPHWSLAGAIQQGRVALRMVCLLSSYDLAKANTDVLVLTDQ